MAGRVLTVRRWVATAAAAVSLVVCVGVGVLWVAGDREVRVLGWHYGWWGKGGTAKAVAVRGTSYWGTMGLVVEYASYGPKTLVERRSYAYVHQTGLRRMRLGPSDAGYFLMRPAVAARDHALLTQLDGREERWVGVVRHWVVMVLLLVGPVWWLNGHLRERRAKRVGVCAGCGYDLRATPGRCPECGLDVGEARMEGAEGVGK